MEASRPGGSVIASRIESIALTLAVGTIFLQAFLVMLVGPLASADLLDHCMPRYTGNAAIPAGYGAAYDVWNTARSVIFIFECDAENNATLVATSTGATPTQYVYKNGYRWNGASWIPITFTGTPAPGMSDWLKLPAKVDVAASDLRPPTSYTYFAAYTCALDGSEWKCGCRDSVCASHSWQLQAMRKNNPDYGNTNGTVDGTGTTAGTTAGSTTGDQPPVIINCAGTLKATPSANDAIGQCYTSQKVAYTDSAKGNQAYRLTTWGKQLGQDIRIGHVVGAQDNHQWSNDSSKITFEMKVGSQFAVFVMDVNTGVATLVSKTSNGRGSTFNRDTTNSSEVIFWVEGSGYMDLVAVNVTSFAKRTIYHVIGATDASSVSQSFDQFGRYIQAWITGRGSCTAPVCSDRVQSVVFDTRPGGSAGPAIIHHAFPFDPDIQFTLNASDHDLYRDGAMWNPFYTGKAMIDQCYPLTPAGKCPTGVSGHRYAVYDFNTDTSVPWPEWPAHSTWSADGLYTIGDHGVIKINPTTNAATCQNASGRCNTRESGGLYNSHSQTYGNLSPSERGLGMNQHVSASTNNGRFQQPTLSVVANVPFITGWQNDPTYTMGYTFESDGDGRRQQYSPNGSWLMWRSNMQNSLGRPASIGPNDGSSGTRDLFMIRVQ